MPEQCIQVDRLPEDIRAFWERKQQELGEALVRFSYGILITSSKESSSMSEKCGVVYLMERHLCFEDFNKPPLFFQTKTSEFTKTQLKIPRQSLAKAEVLQQKEFEQRFFGLEPSSSLFQNIQNLFRQQSSYLVVTETQGTIHIFRDLDTPERWVEALSPEAL